ncbi:hypothetical protein MNB_SUP05-5-1139 [hydrothermal vent metagenome]|uniref:Uncharacterized protein n=1 Tax=hydrothermal vent metagenome TaxID=652676 RepID=A0A1W1CVV2_9ZZZZ
MLDITNTQTLLDKAQEQSNKTQDKQYKETIRLYYIARYFVSIFEAFGHKVPIQVWNEYRNAFDHFARHMTMSERDSNHIKKIESHIQRAVLDICKFLCLEYADFFKEEIAEHTDYLGLVDNGKFLTSIENIFNNAQKIFTEAKQVDSSLGSNNEKDKQVVEYYCNAVFEYKKIHTMFTNTQTLLDKAQEQSNKTQDKQYQ